MLVSMPISSYVYCQIIIEYGQIQDDWLTFWLALAERI